MADKMKAIQAYSPRLQLSKPISQNFLVEYIGDRTGLNKGTILNVLCEFHDSLEFFGKNAQPVRLDGIGIFKPGINKDGEIHLNFKADKALTMKFNQPSDPYKGPIKNKDMIDKTAEDYIQRWNEEHPGDPVELKDS